MQDMRLVGAVLVGLLGQGCAGSGPRAEAAGSDLEPPSPGPLSLERATRLALDLVNHDRAEHGLKAVEWDETAARAAQRHAEDMAAHGFTSHWGTDGSVPEQRYTEAGGTHMVQENSACFFDGVARELDHGPGYLGAELEKIESAFVTEVPPHDGHRQNILKPAHNRLGIGLARPEGLDRPCMAQEFVDQYGEFDPLPAEVGLGQPIRVSGEVRSPATFGGVGLARLDVAKPRDAKALNRTSTYRILDPYAIYFPRGMKTPKPVEVVGARFSIDLVLSDQGRPGRYEVSVWGRFPGSDALEIVSLRTVLVR
jgi:uncharacterized protein YkwD